MAVKSPPANRLTITAQPAEPEPLGVFAIRLVTIIHLLILGEAIREPLRLFTIAKNKK